METIDKTYLTNLMHGNETLALKFLDIFKAQAPRQLEDLRCQLTNQDWEGVSNTAHSLKSQFNYLGLSWLAQQIGDIELLADEDKTDGISSLLTEIEAQFYKLFAREFGDFD